MFLIREAVVTNINFEITDMMPKLFIALLLFTSSFLKAQQFSQYIHIDQFGYLPDSDKVAVLANPITGYDASNSYTPGNQFALVDQSTSEHVFIGAPAIWNAGQTHDQSGNQGWYFDFSLYRKPGTYYVLDIENQLKSYDFQISEDIYQEVLVDAVKMFYYNRCNMEKQQPFAASDWTDINNFNSALQDYNSRYVSDPSNASLERDLSGGWFDAGDYNKYVTFAVEPIHQLLYAFKDNPSVFSDAFNIPESGNGVPDILDEIRYETDWLLKMINPDGSVIIKIGSISYDENANSPPSANTDPRYYGPTCTSASIAVAGALSHLALVLDENAIWPDYSTSIKQKAQDCFAYALSFLNSNTLEVNCDDGTILSGDADWDEATQRKKAVLAAIYLWELTGDNSYHDYLINNINSVSFINNNWLGVDELVELEALLHYRTIDGANSGVSDEIIQSITPHVSNDWNAYFGFNDLDLYRSYMPDWSYHWGSNKSKSDYANMNRVLSKFDIDPARSHLMDQKLREHVHYFHGVNPQNLVYLSNMYNRGADNCTDEIYHSWFDDGTIYDGFAGNNVGPAPGFVVGGANKDYSISNNSPPYGQPSQKSYLDFNDGYPNDSWEISEPAIYYQASYIRMLASSLLEPAPVNDAIYLDASAIGKSDGSSWLDAYTSIDQVYRHKTLSKVDTVYIAQAIYAPDTLNRAFAYPFGSDIVLKSGYAPGGAVYDPQLYRATLSGNIGAAAESDNLYHAFSINGASINIKLINLILSEGHANGADGNALGAGIRCNAFIDLENVLITNNKGIDLPSVGVYINSGKVLKSKNVVVQGNSAL